MNDFADHTVGEVRKTIEKLLKGKFEGNRERKTQEKLTAQLVSCCQPRVRYHFSRELAQRGIVVSYRISRTSFRGSIWGLRRERPWWRWPASTRSNRRSCQSSRIWRELFRCNRRETEEEKRVKFKKFHDKLRLKLTAISIMWWSPWLTVSFTLAPCIEWSIEPWSIAPWSMWSWCDIGAPVVVVVATTWLWWLWWEWSWSIFAVSEKKKRSTTVIKVHESIHNLTLFNCQSIFFFPSPAFT